MEKLGDVNVKFGSFFLSIYLIGPIYAGPKWRHFFACGVNRAGVIRMVNLILKNIKLFPLLSRSFHYVTELHSETK